MQKPINRGLLAGLLAVPASAAPPTNSPRGPLPPGGPAGARNAQLSNNETLFIGAAVLVIGLGLYLASGTTDFPGVSSGSNGSSGGSGGSSGGSGGGTTNIPPPTTTTTTTTTTR